MFLIKFFPLFFIFMYRRRTSTRRPYSSYSRRAPYKTVKYSSETCSFNNTLTIDATEQVAAVIIAATQVQGMRKAKNFTLKLSVPVPLCLYALVVFVPQGTAPSHANSGTPLNPSSLYEPNQHLIMSTIVQPNMTSPIILRSSLARNLNSGDTLQLIIFNPNIAAVEDIPFAVTFNYAMTY
jgi:hypothetical protein